MSHPTTDAQRLNAIRSHVQNLGHTLSPIYFETYHEIDGAARLACCQNCGRRLRFGGRQYGRNRSDIFHNSHILDHRCDGNKLRALESKAWLTGCAPRLLLERLTAAVAELPAELQIYFDPGEFDASNQRLESEDGVWRLQWELREYPDDPISEENRQSASGIVELIRMVEERDMLPARYIGPRYNPNVGEDPAHWIVQPLEKNNDGLVYLLPDKGWTFRRRNGVVGYPVVFDDLALEPHIQSMAEAIMARPEPLDTMLLSGYDLDPMGAYNL